MVGLDHSKECSKEDDQVPYELKTDCQPPAQGERTYQVLKGLIHTTLKGIISTVY